MKRRVTTTLAAILFCATAVYAAQDATRWIKYDSAEGRYSILLPKEPELDTQDAQNSDGVQFKQHLASVSDGTSFYMISYFDYAPQINYSFDKGRDGMVAAVKGQLLSESNISLGVHAGRELKVSATDSQGTDFIIHARFYDVNRRIYVLQRIYQRERDDAANSQVTSKYFDSFQAK